MIEQLAGLGVRRDGRVAARGHHGHAPPQDGVIVAGQLGRQLRVPRRAAAPAGDARAAAGDRRARAARSACSARATRSTTIADSDELVSLDGAARGRRRRPRRGHGVVRRRALRYGELAAALDAEGLALHNLASLPHISVAGAVATATHGSGDGNGNLATAVAALELVTSERRDRDRARAATTDFDGLVVGLGALGAVTRVTLDVEPAYEVRQRVFEDLAWDALFEHFDAITPPATASACSPVWGETSTRCGSRPASDGRSRSRADLFGARPATADRHPILGIDPVNCTPQLGRPGPWSDRLPHFRMGFTPSTGEELQSEYLVPRAPRRRGDRGGARARRRDPPAAPGDRDPHGRRRPPVDEPAVRDATRSASTSRGSASRRPSSALLADVEAALEPFGARPHWGKLFVAAGRSRRSTSAPPDFARAGRAARSARRVPQRLAASAWWDHDGMSAVENLAQAYHQRRADFVVRGAVRRLAAQALRPRRAREGRAAGASRHHARLRRNRSRRSTTTHHGAAFAIAHDANSPIALDLLVAEPRTSCTTSVRRRPGDLTDMSPAPDTPTGCVWELGVVEFERQAWIEDVIGNPAGPDLDRYMARRFNGSSTRGPRAAPAAPARRAPRSHSPTFPAELFCSVITVAPSCSSSRRRSAICSGSEAAMMFCANSSSLISSSPCSYILRGSCQSSLKYSSG